MKRASLLIAFTLLVTASAFAQNSSEIGFLLGGSKRFISGGDKWKVSNSVHEFWYGYHIEPDTMVKIKAGEITMPLGDEATVKATNAEKGRVQHVDLLIDYRFDEMWGTTGLFAGAGLYRQRSGPGTAEGTDYGFSAGVNGDFPMTRRYGIVVEGAYHWINYSYKPRAITLTGGLRIKL